MNPKPNSPTLFVDHLTVIDCAYLCAQHGLVGESWICDVELSGALNNASMIMDFAHVKKTIKRAIDDWVDHTLIVPTESPNLTLPLTQPSPLEGARASNSLSLVEGEGWGEGENPSQHQLTLSFTFLPPILNSELSTLNSYLTHSSPTQALCLLPEAQVTAENVARYLERRLMEVVDSTVSQIRITLRTEPTDQPYYHYVHGLKKHDGNCQRIAHGHRSRIRIWRNGNLDAALERDIATRLAYAYIGTREDIASIDATHTHFAYTAPQGAYALSYPSAHCHIMDADSTVECIATHIAALLKAEHPSDSFTVRAYEGVMKGAVVRS